MRQRSFQTSLKLLKYFSLYNYAQNVSDVSVDFDGGRAELEGVYGCLCIYVPSMRILWVVMLFIDIDTNCTVRVISNWRKAEGEDGEAWAKVSEWNFCSWSRGHEFKLWLGQISEWLKKYP